MTELYEGIGFEDISIGDMNDTPTRDTIGTAIAHKNIDGQEVVAVAIRGSEYDCEWSANLTAGEEGDIEGFAKPMTVSLITAASPTRSRPQRTTAATVRQARTTSQAAKLRAAHRKTTAARPLRLHHRQQFLLNRIRTPTQVQAALRCRWQLSREC